VSILARFTAASDVTTQQYDESLGLLEASGEWPPDGLEYHVAFIVDGSLRVSEIWDSREQLDAFAERLMPVLAELGVELAGPPELLEVHNTIKR
jgi:hypothetical protein